MSTATLDQAKYILTLMSQKGVTKESLTTLVEAGHLADLLEASKLPDREKFRRFLDLDPLELRIVVDYGMSLQEMTAAGRYDWVNDDITPERFPIVGNGVVEYEAKLFHFGRYISSEAADEEIKTADKQNPWESAKIGCLLAFGAASPDMQRKFPIVSLGSSCLIHGDRIVPLLWKYASERLLNLHWWGIDWRDDYRFLAVRKISVS